MLKLDSKTRCNSLLDMLERFLEVKSSLARAMIDCDIEMDITNSEFGVINDLVKALQPVTIGSERLGNRSTTLLSSEGIFSFILKELDEQNSPFSVELKSSLFERIKDRRKKALGLMKYLHCGKYYDNCEGVLPALPAKSTLVDAAKMFTRMFVIPNKEDPGFEPQLSEGNENVDISIEEEMTLAHKLQAAIEQVHSISKKEYGCKHIGKEFNVFVVTGERRQNLEKIFQALKNVPPTSVEAERAFSAAGLFITKLKTRLTDRSSDRLCF